MEANDDQALDLWRAMLWPAQWDVNLVGELQSGLRAVLPRMHDGPEKLALRISEWIAAILVLAPDALEVMTRTIFFRAADADALEQMARVFETSLKDAGERASRLWEDRIKPVFVDHWPADQAKRSNHLSNTLVSMAIATRDSFPDAITVLERKGLIVRGNTANIVSDLSDPPADENSYDIVANHPREVLTVLALSVDDHLEPWNFPALKGILDRIGNHAPALQNDPRLIRLRGLIAQG
jgi:hypothetical protein